MKSLKLMSKIKEIVLLIFSKFIGDPLLILLSALSIISIVIQEEFISPSLFSEYVIKIYQMLISDIEDKVEPIVEIVLSKFTELLKIQTPDFKADWGNFFVAYCAYLFASAAATTPR